jgi:Domain of unknown function (DUF4177)
MMFVICPSCGEKGGLPNHLIGKKIRCQKCGKSFLAAAPTAESLVSGAALNLIAVAGKSSGDSIDVDGLDASTWTATAVVAEKPVVAEVPVHEEAHHEPAPVFTASHHEAEHSDAPVKQYKVLTQKDKWFEGKFDLAKLEEALNHYAHQGWVVRAMSTPHVMGFTGVSKEEIVVLLER